MRTIRLPRFYQLDLIIQPVFVYACLALSVVMALLGVLFLQLSWGQAIIGGLAFGVLHALSVFAHDLGHAIAARGVGYPMRGIEFGRYGLLAVTLYPSNEPELPGKIHIRRAWGGPIMSFIVALLLGLLTFVLPRHSTLWWVALIGSWHNLVTFSLQVLLPVPWADGGTLAKWR